jgi:transposase-like protein
MDLIQEAIEDVESRKPGDKFSYGEVARKFGVNQTTLSRRHQGQQRTSATKANRQQLLSPQQKLEPVQYR